MFNRCYCGLDLLPVCFVSILFITLAISFTVAVSKHDVFPWFPAISDTATESPESNIFAQLVNLASFIGFALVYIRYLQVKRDVQWLEGNKQIIFINRVGLAFGFLSVLGSSMVANFPETQVRVVHDIGAVMFFISGVVYSWTHVLISYRMRKLGLISNCVCLTRVIFTVMSTVSLFVCGTMMDYASDKWPSVNKFHWNSTDPGYKEHVIGNAFEWSMVICFSLMLLTFTTELCDKKLTVKLQRYSLITTAVYSDLEV